MELSSSRPSGQQSASLLSDPAPPTYDEETDPNFLQRVQKNLPEWPGFHPRKVAKFTRQLSGKGQTSQDDEEDDGKLDCSVGSVFAIIMMVLTFLVVLVLLLIPVAMITVGAYFYEDCAEVSPYPMWLVVGGAEICAIYLFFICMGATDCTNNLGVVCLFSLFLIFPLIWYVFGCWYLWAVFTRSKVDKSVSLIYGEWVKWEDFQQTDCIYPYWVVYSLVVTPLALIGLGVGIVVVGGIVICFTTNIDDEEEAPNQNAGTQLV